MAFLVLGVTLGLSACGSNSAEVRISDAGATSSRPAASSGAALTGSSTSATRRAWVDQGFCVGYDSLDELLQHVDVVVRARVLPAPERTTDEELDHHDRLGQPVPMLVYSADVEEILFGELARDVRIPRYDPSLANADEVELPVGKEVVLLMSERLGYFNLMCGDEGLVEVDPGGGLTWHIGDRDPIAFPSTYEDLLAALR